MPRQTERRDQSVLNHLIDIKTSLAENTAETRALKEQVTTLNGKVAGHETRLQASESSQALANQALKLLQDRENRQDDFWRENRGKIMWGVIAVILMLFYYLLTNNGFPKFLSN